MDDPYENDPLRVDTDEAKRIIEGFSPRGTFAVLAIYAIWFALTWLYFWYGLFLPAGPVN
ncbi:hypothetical protein VK792_19115 [Mesobacterium sp. TK19101]|uniref:Uncharacterized protein n=1 Tax=Mesobacterium hydrothermale TaxID=3111907 RepID=A0ABU6HM50_9RHOB|nr:hypothetical protein [Mesobacterium sp. TK19101]MEC3863401.1 hypothetical protein [Mesobacterium sp. TK19101]